MRALGGISPLGLRRSGGRKHRSLLLVNLRQYTDPLWRFIRVAGAVFVKTERLQSTRKGKEQNCGCKKRAQIEMPFPGSPDKRLCRFGLL